MSPVRWSALTASIALAASVVSATIGLAATAGGRQWLHRVDASVLGERAMDTMARLRSNEDWSTAEALRPGQDYDWMRAGGTPMRVAHALGESGSVTANTLAAASRAYAAGFRLLEVDLVDDNGELRCQHDPGPQGDLVQDGCTFDALIAAVPPDAWLVLDIKTDFATVGQQIVDRVLATGDARRIVFQLYRPDDVALFNRWQARMSAQAPLPGPILTAYLAHRRIDHVAKHAARIGVKAFTLPLDRLPALSQKAASGVVLVHPVHNCTTWAQALLRADGAYTLSSLHCGLPSSIRSP
ncbi:hypothetical protein [Aquincola sp. J276]|uniref:hypothetical protein n=1 Tax=Aquincola sp. J276 TaxID=2898432 RepID=UPI0021510C6B|nr:hypothetical protein [Aquincola sp. J276]MCR5866958.1 hypothetical protein [Aquincola sp. J276]